MKLNIINEVNEMENKDRPGSPEWRAAQYDDVDFDKLATMTFKQAKIYYNSKGQLSYSAPFVVQGHQVWLDFIKTDDGSYRQVFGESPIVAKVLIDY